MCGRVIYIKELNEYVPEFQVKWVKRQLGDVEIPYQPNYNCAPTLPLWGIVNKEPETIQPMIWGLRPKWWSEPKMQINFQSEKLGGTWKPLFSKRCVVITDGYYEWLKQGKIKQPYLIRNSGSLTLPMAALYSERNGLLEVSILTRPPVNNIEGIHNRMPAILRQTNIGHWLDEALTISDASDLISDTYEEELRFHPVSSRVNNARNNEPNLIKEIDPPAQAIQTDLFG